ncbi:phage head-tail adapter protein [Macrococcoides caseolyticum]|uniref:Phage head-tail adapter protein n=1 Tax=Macrococcoides caseolyticum TaxID=69966 RepID=A0ACC9MU05_9STAP|nr:phage head-tail adapter protein [Macrococcus caseolyticus]PKE57281.1 phage head-tail adapter protein [Macrococcus caseolyticus]PKF14009.1 phage head-tail adapter protein [Macrococcus caseolyticus]
MLPEDVRRINEWQPTQYDDAKLLYLVDVYRGLAEEHCNAEFVVPFPEGVQIFIAKSIKYADLDFLSSKSMGTVSYSINSNLPSTLYRTLKKHRKMVW